MFNQRPSALWALKLGDSIPEKTVFWVTFIVCTILPLFFAILFTIFVTAFKATNPLTIITSVGFFLTLVGNFFNALLVDDTGSVRSKNPRLGMIISGITFVLALFSAVAVFAFSNSFALGTNQCQLVQLLTCIFGALPILLFSAYAFYQSYQTPTYVAETASNSASLATNHLEREPNIVSSHTNVDTTLVQPAADSKCPEVLVWDEETKQLVPQSNELAERLKFHSSITRCLTQ